MEDSHQSRVDEFVERTRCFLRNQKRKIKMARTREKNAIRKNVKKLFKNTPEGKGLLKSQKKDG